MLKAIFEALATVVGYLITKHGPPSKEDLVALLAPIARDELGRAMLENAFAELGRAANTPPAKVDVPDLELATDLGIHHEELGWFAGQGPAGPVWVKNAREADKYRTIATAEHGLALHGLRGVPGVSIETLPTEE